MSEVLIVSDNWAVSTELEWTINCHPRWFCDNKKDITDWLASEGIMPYNLITNKIFLYNDAQLQYFTLRWR